MKNILQLLSLVCLSGMLACSDDGDHKLPVPETTVRLEGAIGQSTRAVIGSGYEKDLAVCFARQDETSVSSGSYGTWSLYKATRSGGKGNRPILFDELQQYPPDGSRIRLHGYYPAGDGTANDLQTGRVTFTIDGKTDIMATGCLTATLYVPASTCTFRHLLTQIALVCYSDRTAEWGIVTKIEAAGITTGQQLDWQTETPGLTASSSGQVANVAVQDIDGLPLVQVDEGGELPDAQGYILLPASGGTAAHPLQLRVTTTKDGNGNETETVSRVPVIVEGGFQAGKRHVVSLFFTDGQKIQTTSVSVERWTEQDAGEIPI
ncbi:fimbrillin family protein [Parabacteroides gordonii]|uniref:fimbrillin family protein n=1 Tax=Parabacteroides gordonii TaxID=574930 RepID=UPI0026F01A31|nr:fimbrillin family protein [Parabacteroides gordonii]